MIEMDVHKNLQSAEGPMELHMQLRLEQGCFATLYGPSGAGKTSTLRILAGLMTPDKGYLTVNGKTWYDSGRAVNRPPQQRRIGFVFQDYALFPHMNVYQNLHFALGSKGDPGILERLMEMISLNGLRNRKPGELSGGQQQRVALARALVQQPELLLLDEPLAALDLEARMQLQDYLLELHREFGLTTLMISHDTGEILKLADKIFVLDKGRISREGTPGEVFASSWVSGKFRFTGEVLYIERQEVVFVVTVRIQNTVVKVVADEEDITSLRVGDTVLLASKAFNPVIYKII